MWRPIRCSSRTAFRRLESSRTSFRRLESSVPLQEAPQAAPASASSSAAAAPASSSSGERSASSSSWRLIKGLLTFSSFAAVGAVSYVSYAYPTEEVERIVNLYRKEYAPPVSAQGGELLEKVKHVLYTTAYEAASKAADAYLDLRKNIEDQVKGFAAPLSDKLLPDLAPEEQHVYTLVLDLNETLVYSDWKRERGWGTFKRPGVEAFLEKLAHYYEIVVYSDQHSFYMDPILERLDQKGCIRYRLAREATQYKDGKHYRDLSKLNRDPKKVMYISGHALESCLQPENAVPIKPWKLEDNDTYLLDLLPFLEFVARQRPPDVRAVLASYKGRDIAAEFRERAKMNQKRVQERRQQGKFWRS